MDAGAAPYSPEGVRAHGLSQSRLPASVAETWTRPRRSTRPPRWRTWRATIGAGDRALLETPMAVRDSRGYNYAEVTAGGVPLSEIEPATMQSRVCRGCI